MTALSIVLGQLAASQSPRVILALRAQDPIPEWITHVLYIGSNLQIAFQGLKGEVLQQIKDRVYGDPEASSYIPSFSLNEIGRSLTASGITRSTIKDARVIKHNRSVWDNDKIGPTDQQSEEGEPLIEMDGVRVEYGAKMIFGTQERGSDGLQWTVRRGDRWGIFGPNGIQSPSDSCTNLTAPRFWKNHSPLSDNLRPPASVLSSNQSLWPQPPPLSWPARNFSVRPPIPHRPFLTRDTCILSPSPHRPPNHRKRLGSHFPWSARPSPRT